MPSLDSMWKKFFAPKPSPLDRYKIKVITAPAELIAAEHLPFEIRYVLAVRPSRFEVFRELLERGFHIGVQSVEKTPERVLQAVDRISREAQHNTIVPWLERLLRDDELPAFGEEELRRAEDKGINLYTETNIIMAERFEFRKITLIETDGATAGEAEKILLDEINRDLYPLAIDAIVHRVIFDNAHTRTEVAQSIIKALILIGPIAHVLEHVLSGLGKVFAASVDDLLSEVAELFALRGSGFTWRQLYKRSRILIPVFILATYGAFQVQPLIEAGKTGWAGVVFGLSAVALSLTTALQSIGMYRNSYVKLAQTGKLKLQSGQSLTRLALRQDFTNPARLGLFVGAGCSPFVAALVFFAWPNLAQNGWILAMLGSTESIVAGLTVVSATRIEKLLFRYRARQAISKLISRR